MSRATPPLTCLAVLCAGLLLASCGGSSEGAGEITLYNGQHEQTTALLVQAFERQTHIKVRVRSGDEATLANQILQEGSSSPADVFYAENTPVLEALREHGLLAPVQAATLAQVPRADDAADGDWVGVSARISALVYDTAQLSATQLPNSLLDLAQPRWSGKLGFAPSETDFQPLVSAVIHLDGVRAAQHWLEGMRSNARTYPDNETVVAQVNNGESALGPVNHYYWFRLRDELGAGGMHSALHYYSPGDPGDLLDLSGAAVLASSARKSQAQAFLAFLVSRAGQEAIAHSHSYEYPLRAGVAPAAGLRPLAQLHPLTLAPAALGDGSQALELEQRLGLL